MRVAHASASLAISRTEHPCLSTVAVELKDIEISLQLFTAFASPVLTSSAFNISASFHSNPTPTKSHAATSHSAPPMTRHITVSTSESSTMPPTSTPTHNGSSAFPVTSHAPTPPPTEPPTKKPVLKCPSVSYSVKGRNKTCIKINGTIKFSAKYLTGNRTHNRTVSIFVYFIYSKTLQR